METFFMSASSSIQRLQIGFHEGMCTSFKNVCALHFKMFLNKIWDRVKPTHTNYLPDEQAKTTSFATLSTISSAPHTFSDFGDFIFPCIRCDCF